MTLCELRWFSQLLRKPTAANVLLPEIGRPPFPVLYLLHGLSDDHTSWIRHSRLEDHAAGFPFIIVMPDAGRSYYANHAAGARMPWATHLAEELPAMVERNFASRTDRAGRCIGGVSMGGYGAMRLALSYPERYLSAHSHSGALMGPDPARGSMSAEEVLAILGGPYAGSSHDLVNLAERASAGGFLPKLRIDCGTEDHLLSDNRQFHRELQRLGIPVDYAESTGTHDWAYWDGQIRSALAFHRAASLEPTQADPPQAVT
jgi:putative tributyrin esterase